MASPKSPGKNAPSRPSSPPPSRPTSSFGEPKSRKKRSKRKRETGAGPSTATSRAASPTSKSRSKSPESLKNSTFEEEDFIAFTFSDAEEKEDTEKINNYPVREWDKGKGKAKDVEGSARKRKVAEVDPNDGYANKKQRVDAASRRAPWAVEVDWDSCNNVAEMLHQEVEAFVRYISPTPAEHEIRSLVVDLIATAVTDAFPDAKVHPFGSYETQLYLPLGDIDLVIESKSMAYSNKTSVLHALANTVKRAGIADRVSIIAKAKVPIVKFVTRHGHFSVDISINQINGVKAGKMVKRYIDELPALRSLVLITKSFLSQRSMNEVFTGGLGSYSIVCLAISFLQMHPKIRRGEIDPSKNLGVLVMEFFELYGCYFNYQEVGISLADGGSYYNKAERGWLDFRSPHLLSIEDPGDPSNDISRGSYGITKVRTTFAGAHGIMTAAAYLHAGYISARRERRHVRLRDRADPEEMSILAHVMGVTQETINHRRVVQEVYDKRVLHRLVGVEPLAATVSTTIPSQQQGSMNTRAAQKSVSEAWKEAEKDIGPAPEDDISRDNEEEESRYGVRQPPKKRRRVGGEIDAHTVYTTDEDGDEEDEHIMVHTGHQESNTEPPIQSSLRDDTDEEEGEYDIDSDHKARRRSYWLAKGNGAIE